MIGELVGQDSRTKFASLDLLLPKKSNGSLESSELGCMEPACTAVFKNRSARPSIPCNCVEFVAINVDVVVV